MIQKKIFFLGKGGTGKTTAAAVTAVGLSARGQNVALISMDPAHNLFDTFQVNTRKNHFQINPNLTVEEIDLTLWLKNYLGSVEKNISESYRHLSSLGLDRHLKIIQYSPGLEEHALIYAFQALQKKYDKYDYMIFDMPPTGLALRFFNHPAMTLTWLKKLMELRKMIIEKKNIIQKIKKGDAPARTDQVYSHLRALELESGALQGLFTSKDDTRVMIVLNADYLSVKESERIQIHFQTLHIPVFGFILNKDENTTWDDAFLKTREVVKFPRNASPLLGIKAIENYLTIPGISRFLDQLCVMPSADF